MFSGGLSEEMGACDREGRKGGGSTWETGARRGSAQEIIKQQLVKGLSCSTAVKGP